MTAPARIGVIGRTVRRFLCAVGGAFAAALVIESHQRHDVAAYRTYTNYLAAAAIIAALLVLFDSTRRVGAQLAAAPVVAGLFMSSVLVTAVPDVSARYALMAAAGGAIRLAAAVDARNPKATEEQLDRIDAATAAISERLSYLEARTVTPHVGPPRPRWGLVAAAAVASFTCGCFCWRPRRRA